MNLPYSLSYDDVLLVPAYSEITAGDTDLKTRCAGDIILNVPVLSAAMDTVTEERLAIAIALEGGAGVIHRNLSPEVQAEHVARVKRYLNWIIQAPITIRADDTVADIRSVMRMNGISGLPVVDTAGCLTGIVTSRDLRFCGSDEKLVQDIMTPDPVTITGVPTTESAQELFDHHKIEKLPVVDDDNRLIGLITVKDMEKHQSFPNAATDEHGRLIVGAAVSPVDYLKRMPLLMESRVDFVAIDTAHGDTRSVLDACADLKKRFDVPVIAGNAATAEATRRLVEAGADAVKVGVGPGSICTTRVVAGIGVPQFSAVMECSREAARHNIPVIADGGIKYSGDIAKAVGAGASSVMIGNLFAGLREAPGKEILFDGRMFKEYRGMGSIGAIQDGSGDRYQMKQSDEPVPEGIEGRVPYKGELKPFLYQLMTGLRKGMAYCGCSSIDQLRKYGNFVRISPAGLKESHPHDVAITQEAPNYTR